MAFVNFQMLGLFFLGIAMGIFLQSVPLPEELSFVVPYLGLIFLVLGVAAFIKH
jgi:tellurite resistance protein TehA-like permease